MLPRPASPSWLLSNRRHYQDCLVWLFTEAYRNLYFGAESQGYRSLSTESLSRSRLGMKLLSACFQPLVGVLAVPGK